MKAHRVLLLLPFAAAFYLATFILLCGKKQKGT
jgi:hypothetical protein